jgi:hypothetical protein
MCTSRKGVSENGADSTTKARHTVIVVYCPKLESARQSSASIPRHYQLHPETRFLVRATAGDLGQLNAELGTFRPRDRLISFGPHPSHVYSLWYYDLEARRRFQILTIVIAFAYGAFNSLVLGRPDKQVTYESLGLVFLLTAGFTLLYCVQKEARAVNRASASLREIFQSRSFLEFSAASALLIAFAALLVHVPNDRVQAASLDLRLRQALSSPDPFDVKTIDRVTSVLRKATADQLPINAALVNAAGTRYVGAPQQNPAAWQAGLEILSYHSARVAETESFPQRTCINVGKASGIVAEVSDSSITGCSQGLDNVSWKNVVFQNVTIVYHGGPVTLENAQFQNCRFNLDDSVQGRELGKALLGSNSVTLSLLPK